MDTIALTNIPYGFVISPLTIVARVNGQGSTQACDSGTGVCVVFEIPLSANQNPQNADILATIQGPGGLGWVGFGFGEQMTGSLIFVMWPDNTDVVVSPRYA